MAHTDPAGRPLDPSFRAHLDAIIVGTAVGTAIGLIARSPAIARRIAFRSALEAYDRAAANEAPAVRGSVDAAWVATQVAKREAHVRRTALSLGLDPEVAVESVRAMGFPAWLASHSGRLAR